ncbi:anion permease [Marinobacteraceae bacterium S3BR75-40.1]
MAYLESGETVSRPSTVVGEAMKLGLAGLFLVAVWWFVSSGPGAVSPLLVIAAVFGGYMALNIGANDVANNVGPAVGSQALTMAGAIAIAVVFEAGGALIAGGDVVGTIKKGIIDPTILPSADPFLWLMTGALLAAALWLNLATWMGAPVSTTHSIVGGVLGAGIAAGGLAIADWGVVGAIVASWVISPLLGGIIAALTLYLIKRTVLYREDRIAAARQVVPWVLSILAWAFVSYLLVKGLKKVWKVDFTEALGIGLAVAVAVFFLARQWIQGRIKELAGSQDGVNSLFTWPLIFSAALLSFAHGANDVANAVGPLAAINDAVAHGAIASAAKIPLWVMLIGALGLSVGLALFGPKLIRTVGSEITELDKTRAFCIALAAAITVLIASQLGLPVSSTHTALGAVFGVGFLREYLKTSYASKLHELLDAHEGPEHRQIKAFLDDFEQASIEEMEAMIKTAKARKKEIGLKKKERKRLKKIYKQELVRRRQLYKIAAAWIITVPASAFLAALLYFTIRGIMV